MLDKSLPYVNIIMKRESSTFLPEYKLPEGYYFSYYLPGDEKDWAEIETSVGEFDTIEEGLDYFNKDYLPHMDELKKRCFFICNEKGKKVGTMTNWWRFKEEKRVPSPEWIGLNPEYQNKGLGMALVLFGIKEMTVLEGDVDMYLHTQSWSYKAIGIYMTAGFKIMKNETFNNCLNEYEKAIPVLNTVLKNNYKLEE